MKPGWIEKKLGEVCTLQRGFDLPKGSRTPGDFPLVSSSGIIDSHDIWKVKAPGVVTGRSGSVGNVFYIENDFWPLNTTLYVKDFHGNYPRYVFYLLQQFGLGKFSSGVGVPTLNRNFVHDEIVSIPVSIPEQERIVAVLDEAFASIAQAIANAERNLVNARELFESVLHSYFEEKGNEWKTFQLEELTEKDSPITYGVVKPGEFGEIRFVRGGDISQGRVLVDQLRTITKEVSDQYKRTLLRGGELLMCLVGQPGQVAVAPDELAGANIARQVGLIRLRQDVNSEFVRYFLQSRNGQNALGAYTGGSVQQVINLGDLRLVEILLPSLAEQRAIVERLEALSAETGRLEAVYRQKVAALEELKKSVLQKAFAGEL